MKNGLIEFFGCKSGTYNEDSRNEDIVFKILSSATTGVGEARDFTEFTLPSK